MVPESYYVRVRGRISGPFDLPELQKLARRGQLSRIHELSVDKVSWTDAGALRQLFPTPVPPRAAETPAVPAVSPAAAGSRQAVIPLSPLVSDDGQLAPAPDQDRYYYLQANETFGPIALDVLRVRLLDGQLRPDDLAWKEGDKFSYAARELLASDPGQGTGPQSTGTADGGFAESKRRTDLARADLSVSGQVRQSRRMSVMTGMIAAFLLLLCVNCPNDRQGGRLIWWWDVVRGGQSAMLSVSLLYSLTAGVALPFFVLGFRGLGRGVAFLVVAVLGISLMLVLGMVSTGRSGLFMTEVVIMLATAFVVTLSLAHNPNERWATVRNLTLLGGAALIAANLLAPLSFIWAMADGRRIVGGAVTLILVGITTRVASLVCGVACLVRWFRPCGRVAMFTLHLSALISVGMAILFAVVFGIGVVSNQIPSPEASRFVALNLARWVAVAGALVGLFAAGLYEILVVLSSRRDTRG